MQASECLKCFTTSQLVVVLPIGGTAIAIPLKFHNYLLLLCCLLFHLELSFHIVQFSRCAFQPLLRSDFSIQIPLGTEIRSHKLVGQSGLEPPTSRLSVVCSSQLSYWPVWWRLAGSNRCPPACKAGALPAELNPHTLL